MDHASASLSSDHSLQHATDASNGQVKGLAGCWKLGAGRALKVHADRAGVLRIAHGRVWATFDGADQDAQVRAGDHFLSRGESLSLLPGQSLVMESFGAAHAASAYFSWEPSCLAATVRQPIAAAGWRAGVLTPLAELRTALGMAAGALGRLGQGLVMGAAAIFQAALTPVVVGFVAARARPAAAGHDFDVYRTSGHCNGNVLAMSNLV